MRPDDTISPVDTAAGAKPPSKQFFGAQLSVAIALTVSPGCNIVMPPDIERGAITAAGELTVHAILSSMTDTILAVISAGGLPGIVLLMALESACIPIPSEIVMPFAGYLVSTGQFSLWSVALAGAVGCNIGSLVAYEIGARGGRPMVEKFSRHSLFGAHELRLAEAFFERWGAGATFFGRLLPVVRTFLALPAGLARMNRLQFHAYTFVGSFLWCLALAWVGKALGRNWNDSAALSTAFHVADVVIVLALVAGLVWYLRYRKRARHAD